MIIAISGLPGSGKSAISRELAGRLKLKRFSWGELLKKEIKKTKVNKLFLSKLVHDNKKLNSLIDNKIKKLTKGRKNYILDSRLSAKLAKADFYIYLFAPQSVRAGRIAGRDGLSYKQALKEIKMREKLEREQYRKQYNFDYTNKRHYNILINTGKKKPASYYAKEILSKIKT